MSTPAPTSSFDIPAARSGTAPPKALQSLPDWAREPLLHFLILGGLLFAVDHFIVSGSEDPGTIVVSTQVDNEAKQLFKTQRGREPNKQELEALRQVWLDNEVLYREGLALEVDKGDSAIRERVIFKALSVVDANVKLPALDDKKLREWFEANHARYDEPARYDFQEAALSGDNSEATVRTFVEALNTGTPGDAKAGLRVFKGRPQSNLEQSYGPEFAPELDQSPPGQWRALKTRDGWRAMRLDAITPARKAEYERFRGVALGDWREATATELRTAAVRALAKKYDIRIEAEAASK